MLALSITVDERAELVQEIRRTVGASLVFALPLPSLSSGDHKARPYTNVPMGCGLIELPVQGAVLDCLSQVRPTYPLFACQVGDGAGDFEDARVRPGA